MIDFEPSFAAAFPQPGTEFEHYAARIQLFTEAGRSAPYTPASNDSEKIAVILVDFQHDFADPAGTLYVPGSQDDASRFLRWFYTNGHKITTVYASLDTHIPLQIFFSSWWTNSETGAHPEPYTVISAENVDNQTWEPAFEPQWSVDYVHRLQQQAKKELMIWPYHTMQGTLGHMLLAPISEAIAWHSAARLAQPFYIEKGLTRRTEFYGTFGAEVPDPKVSDSSLNVPLLDAIMEHNRVYIAGEAKSHCVLETLRQLVDHYANRPDMLRKLYLLKDCSSSVQHPIINFDALAETELAKMRELGINIVLSTDAVI